MSKVLQPLFVNKKRTIHGEQIDSTPSVASSKINVIDAGCTTIENMLLKVRDEGNQMQIKEDTKSINALFEIIVEHNSRIEKCEQTNKLLQEQFSDLSQLVNSSLLTSFSQSSCAGVSHIRNTHDDLSSCAMKDSFGILPIFLNSSLPPFKHAAVQANSVCNWTSEMVEELITAVSVSLQCWLREKEQLLLLKRLLIQSKCVEDTTVDTWYKQEIEYLEDYYKQENNALQYELQDIRKLLRCMPHSESASEYTRSISVQKKESEIQMRSIPELDFKSLPTSTEQSYPSSASWKDRPTMQNNTVIDLVIKNIDFISEVIYDTNYWNPVDVQTKVKQILQSQFEGDYELVDIATIAFVNEFYYALNDLGIDSDELLSSNDQQKMKAIIHNSLFKQKLLLPSNSNSIPSETRKVPIQLARKNGIFQINKFCNELHENMDDYINEISRDILNDLSTSEFQ